MEDPSLRILPFSSPRKALALEPRMRRAGQDGMEQQLDVLFFQFPKFIPPATGYIDDARSAVATSWSRDAAQTVRALATQALHCGTS